MKKFLSILLAVVLIFSVLTCVGCEADKKEENTITYYHYEPQVSTVSSFIYDYLEFENTYYNSSVIGDIVNDYLNGDISKEKFIRQLTAATEIYLTE